MGLILERVFAFLELDCVLIAGGGIPVFTCPTELLDLFIAGMAAGDDQPRGEGEGKPEDMKTCGSDCP
jgi:hypothetical protein